MLQLVLWNAFFYAFGLFNWFYYILIVLRFERTKASTERQTLQLALARDKFWNLSRQPIPGFNHAFFKTRSGRKLHYIVKEGTPNSKSLFVFIHGFPDSCMTWRHLFREPAMLNLGSTILCVSLPGYGGSDTLDKHDTTVLENLTEFIVAMRERYDSSNAQYDRNTVVVGHDWGCVIAIRLAAEAPAIADRFVLSNGPHVQLALANKDRILHSAAKIFKQFRSAPQHNFGCLSKSYHTVKPLVSQVLMFGYIFAFHLPSFLVRFLGGGLHQAFLRLISRSAHGKDRDEYNEAEDLGAVLGPGMIEVDTTTSDAGHESYGFGVEQRAASPGEAFWQMTSYYRDGLAFGKWNKSLETIADLYSLESDSPASSSPLQRRKSSSASSGIFPEQYKGSLGAPATILWGQKDTAVSRSVCLDGIGDYLIRGSEVILLPRSGHWVAVEREGRRALAQVLSHFAEPDDLGSIYVKDVVQKVYERSTTMVKK